MHDQASRTATISHHGSIVETGMLGMTMDFAAGETLDLFNNFLIGRTTLP
jgi:Cu/Ag efflux protein CusF